MNIEALAEKACNLANDDLPDILYEIQDHMVLDIDGDPCGPLSDDERLLAAYEAGRQSVLVKFSEAIETFPKTDPVKNKWMEGEIAKNKNIIGEQS